jgi:two-component system nitrogen regulation response regulator GlnG
VQMVQRAALSNKESINPGNEKSNPAEIVGEAPAMQEVFRAIGKLSNSSSTVLLMGQSGTGKELVAKALYEHSPRKDKPFVALNMADIPKDLLEAELFGHEKGAFTGADEKRIGRFEQANGGTLFLDEIGDMQLETQTRLLRVLSNGEFYRVGGREPIKVDVRIITATHQKLESHVKEGTFREDLFHRLNVIKITLPNLNERREDVPALSKHFFRVSSEELEEERKFLSAEVERYFMSLPWPGNVRQLENTCRWLTVMAPTREIRLEDLPDELMAEDSESSKSWTDSLKSWAEGSAAKGEINLLETTLPEFERTMIKVALNKTMGKKKDAALLLGWGRNTLTRKIKELGLEKEY